MAVFTEVSIEQVQRLLDNMRIGKAQKLTGISAGIENSNYFLTTSKGEYVLTIFERLSATQLPFYLKLMRHLAQQNILVPNPETDLQGGFLFELAHKPCCIANRLEGKSELAPSVEHCRIIGENLAKMHLAAQSFPESQPNLRGLVWWQQTVPQLLRYLTPAQQQLLQDELAQQTELATTTEYAALPKAAVHCDLFRDNVLFTVKDAKPALGGFFDFYFAGYDSMLFDLSVCLNDWCIDHLTKTEQPELSAALLEAYTKVRPLTAAEQQLLPLLLRAAALRFWISRLWDFYLPRDAKLLQPHDPSHFEQLLQYRRNQLY